MYSDKGKKKWPLLVLAAVLLALVLAGGSLYASLAQAERDEEGALAVKRAVEQSALQCYAVEGAYAPDLQYLQDHYGLVVNHDAYYVTYEAFASNLPPTIKVTERRSHDS